MVNRARALLRGDDRVTIGVQSATAIYRCLTDRWQSGDCGCGGCLESFPAARRAGFEGYGGRCSL